MGVNAGVSKEWKVSTEKGREHVRTKVVNQFGLIGSYDASISKSYKNDGMWYDISGANNHLKLTNVGYTSDSKGGLVFGSTSAGDPVIPFANNLTSGITMSTWIKHTGVVGTARIQRYVTLGPEVMCLRHNNTTAASLQAFTYNYLNSVVLNESINQIYTNTYYHLVTTCDFTQATNNFRLYKNGVFLGAATVTLPIKTYTSLSLGGAAEYFEGNMYALSIYNRALTQQEIYRNYLSTYDRFF